MLSPLYCFLNAIVHFYGALPDSGTLAAKDMAVQPSRARVAESIGGWVKVQYTKRTMCDITTVYLLHELHEA